MSIETTALYFSPASDLPLRLLCGFWGGREKVSVLGIVGECAFQQLRLWGWAGAGSGRGSWKIPDGGGRSCRF